MKNFKIGIITALIALTLSIISYGFIGIFALSFNILNWHWAFRLLLLVSVVWIIRAAYLAHRDYRKLKSK